MKALASRILVVLEMLALTGMAYVCYSILQIGPLGDLEDFTALSSFGHVVAVLSLIPLWFLTYHYARWSATAIVRRFTPAWMLAGASVLTVVLIATIGYVGANEAEGLRLMDIVACSVALPFLHLLVVRVLAPPNPSLERP